MSGARKWLLDKADEYERVAITTDRAGDRTLARLYRGIADELREDAASLDADNAEVTT